jgi:hypothetical protein
MKRLFFILLAFVSLNTVAQETVTEPQISEAERIIDKYGGQAVEAFNNAVTKVTPLAEEGFNIAVKLQKAKGIGEIAMAIIFFIAIIFILIIQIISIKKDWSDDAQAFSIILGGIVQIVCLAMGASYLYDGILYLVASEWYAITDILNLIK